MPKRIVKSTVIVYRDGKQVKPVIGEVFDFTDAEVKDIRAINETTLGHIIVPDAPKAEVAHKVA